MLANTDENSNNNFLINFEQQFRQLLLECKSNELIIKTFQENLNNSLKRNNLLEHELETERLNNSLIKMELDTLTTMHDNYRKNCNSSELNKNFLAHDQEYLMNKIFKTQNESIELKQELSKSNSQISTLMANQFKFSQQVNLVTSMLNSLQGEIKKLENESHALVNILCNSRNLAKKIVSALKCSRDSDKLQLNHIQLLVKEVAAIKSNIYMFVNQNDNQQIVKCDDKNIISFNLTHLEICKKRIEILETENNTLYNSLHQMLESQILQNDINKHK